MLKEKFFRDCYRQVGWIPMEPLSFPVEVGDLCQINHGQLQMMTNLSHLGLVERAEYCDPILLNSKGWRFNAGVRQTMCEMEKKSQKIESESPEMDGNRDVVFTRQALHFNESGSFVFHGDAPYCKMLKNWNQIKGDVTLKVTQTHYEFRDVYLVTGITVIDEWALAVARAEDAELNTSTESREIDLFALISHASAQTNHCRDISSYEKSAGKPAYFFRIKKLTLSDKAYDLYFKRLLDNARDLSARAVGNWLGTGVLNNSLLNLMTSNELNLSTAIEFFSWADASLDDVEKFLI